MFVVMSAAVQSGSKSHHRQIQVHVPELHKGPNGPRTSSVKLDTKCLFVNLSLEYLDKKCAIHENPASLKKTLKLL